MWGWASRSARAGSRRPWRSSGRRKKEEKGRDGGALGVLIGKGVPGRGKWCLGAVDLALGDSTASGRRRQRRGAWRRVSWRHGERPGTRVRARRCQGAGQVALRDSPGSIWPWARGGRSPPAAYGGRREQSRPGEREVKVRAYLGFLKFQGPFGKQKFSHTWRAQMEKC